MGTFVLTRQLLHFKSRTPLINLLTEHVMVNFKGDSSTAISRLRALTVLSVVVEECR